jgi:hypothetical protein
VKAEAAPSWAARVERARVGPFVTAESLELPDGTLHRWQSRRQRKHVQGHVEHTWLALSALGWWIGVLFAIGSACFALGALPVYADAVGAHVDDVTFFIGSIFFTTASALQLLQVVLAAPRPSRPGKRRPIELDSIDWWAGAIQLVGTVFFNVSTFHAISASGDASAVNHAVWRPDALGSICFLVASALCWLEACDGWWAWRTRNYAWWICALNLVGSIAFGVSAIAAKTLSSGDLRSLALTNLGTFVGAICFLAGGILLLPERMAADG